MEYKFIFDKPKLRWNLIALYGPFHYEFLTRWYIGKIIGFIEPNFFADGSMNGFIGYVKKQKYFKPGGMHSFTSIIGPHDTLEKAKEKMLSYCI